MNVAIVKLGDPRILSIFTSAGCCLYETISTFAYLYQRFGRKGERINVSSCESNKSWYLFAHKREHNDELIMKLLISAHDDSSVVTEKSNWCNW